MSMALAAQLASQSQLLLPAAQLCVHDWPEGPLQGSLRVHSLQACRMTPGRGPDAVILRSVADQGGEIARNAFVLRDVGRSHAAVHLGPAIDAVVLPRERTLGDAVLTLGADGSLRLHRWPVGAPLPQSQLLGSWPGFRSLTAIRNGPAIEVLAIDTAGIRIRRASWAGSTLGAHSQVFEPGGVQGLCGMDWDQDGAVDLVLATAGGLLVQRWNQAPLASLPLPGSGLPSSNWTSAVARGTTHPDLLVTATWDGHQTTVEWRNATTQGSLQLGPLQLSTIAAYDRDGDGNDDLLLGDAASNTVHVLLRQRTGFTRAFVRLLSGPAAPDSGIGAVAGTDLDGDGDGDVLALNQHSLRVHTFWDALTGEWRPQSLAVDVPSATGAVHALSLSADLPPTLRVLPKNATGLRLLVDGWATDPTTGNVLPTPVLHSDLPVPVPTNHIATMVPLLPGSSVHGRFHLQLHIAFAIELQGGGRTVLPSRLLHVTSDPELERVIRVRVAAELWGLVDGQGKDGGGDGNILGGKTGKHVIGEPPL